MEKAFIKKSDNNKTEDRTTIYRTIKLFQEEGIVHQIDDGKAIAKYAISNEKNLDLHLHFHCTHCGNTLCLPDKVKPDSLSEKYEIKDVNLVLKGKKKKCKKKKKKKKKKNNQLIKKKIMH